MNTNSIPASVSFTVDDLGWLGLSCDAGGSSTHAKEVTFLGVTPDDFGSHDLDGSDLGWMSLESVRSNRYQS